MPYMQYIKGNTVKLALDWGKNDKIGRKSLLEQELIYGIQ